MKQHQMPEHIALRVAELLVALQVVTTVRGRCVECGEPNRDGCGCWLQAMADHVPMSIVFLMDDHGKRQGIK